MRIIDVVHEINCSAETFWKVFLDREFNQTFFLKEAGFSAYEILEQKETETEVTRRLRGSPKTSAPKAMLKIMGDSFGYLEEGRTIKGSNLWTYKNTPNVLPDKLTNEGSIRIEPAGEHQVKRLSQFRIEARIFGLSGIIEGVAEKDFRAGSDQSAQFMNRWIRERKLA